VKSIIRMLEAVYVHVCVCARACACVYNYRSTWTRSLPNSCEYEPVHLFSFFG
jgi:hypothetical protein